MSISEVDRAYLAGIIDGEGSIMLIHNPPRSKERRWEYWSLRVAVSQCDKRLIDWIIERFGGTYSIGKNKRPNQRDHYEWRMDSKKARQVLEAAYPYLVLKREQAEIAFAMIATHKLVGRRGHSVETVEYRRELAAKMKSLNKRGLTHPPAKRVIT